MDMLLRLAQRPVSLETPCDDAETDRCLGDLLPDEAHIPSDETVTDYELKDEIGRCMHALTEGEQRVLRMYYGLGDHEPMTLEEIGTYVGRTRERVRQIKEKLCYVAYDTQFEQKLAHETTVLVKDYELPDGRSLILLATDPYAFGTKTAFSNPAGLSLGIGLHNYPSPASSQEPRRLFSTAEACFSPRLPRAQHRLVAEHRYPFLRLGRFLPRGADERRPPQFVAH